MSRPAAEAIGVIPQYVGHANQWITFLEKTIADAEPEVGNVAFAERARAGLTDLRAAVDDSKTKIAHAEERLPLIQNAAAELTKAQRVYIEADAAIALGTLDAAEALGRFHARVAAHAAVFYWTNVSNTSPASAMHAASKATNEPLRRRLVACMRSAESLRNTQSPMGDQQGFEVRDTMEVLETNYKSNPEEWGLLAVASCSRIAEYRALYPTWKVKKGTVMDNGRPIPTVDEIVQRFDTLFGLFESEARRLREKATAAAMKHARARS